MEGGFAGALQNVFFPEETGDKKCQAAIKAFLLEVRELSANDIHICRTSRNSILCVC